VRVEQEQADFMKRIADEQGRTLQDVHLAFIKYANGRGNLWLTQGLKGFAPLPRFEEPPKENPTMKRKPTPAQIAARERFAEMARSGAFKKKARKKNPRASNPIKKFIVYTETKPGNWKQVRVTENLDVAKDLAKSNAESGYPSIVEDATGAIVYTPKVASNPIVLVTDSKPSKRKANPQAPSIKHKGARNIAYAVEAKRMLASGGSQFEMIAGFPTKAQAQDYIDALLKSYPKGLTLRISAA
jgi:hypothetical protein